MEHHLAFLRMLGRWPKQQVDHINTIRDQNHWSNLREATGTENNANSAGTYKSELGRGIHWGRGKLQVRIEKNGHNYYFGTFDHSDLASAVITRNAAMFQLFGDFCHPDFLPTLEIAETDAWILASTSVALIIGENK